jgi:DMSO/TMAO reductase YedYZ molybdopterin-dependent catalytic subunit
VDPQEAHQRAIEAGLVVHRADPLNGEISIRALAGGVITPKAHFYVRNHFQMPVLDSVAWRLSVGGLVDRPMSLSLPELKRMRSETMMVTLECAGNGRSLLTPATEGEQWGWGAVSTAEWTGVPLTEVLDRSGVKSGARELAFRGADRGAVDGREGEVHFERSLDLDTARASDALLAYAMNGEPLGIQHGYPLRLVVPGWYGVASVKWLTDIQVIDRAFSGYFQADRYQYEWTSDGTVAREPVTLQRVRALITEPKPGEEIERGELTIRGVAWSGAAPIDRVELSIAGGRWQQARLVGERHRYAWQWWELLADVSEPGTISLRARATDVAGRTQPKDPEWNRLGYGANAIQETLVDCR